MIYLNNNTILQDVYIPRQDMLQYTTGSSGTYAEGYADGYDDGTQDQKDKLGVTAFTENGEYEREDGWSAVTVDVPQTGSTARLEEKTVVISADTTNVTPSSGYDGMSAVTVDATEYGQTNYDNGFDDGFDDGYASGSTEEREKLSAVTFTANTAVTMDEGGYSAVTVNVAQTGHTDQELEDAYTSGHTDGMDDQKQLLTTTAFTQNGNYTMENGWSGVTVNIDTASTYQSGYTSGHTDGVSEEKAKLSATTFTANTAVTLNDGGYSAITVNVPQTGTSATLGNGSFSANGTYSASTDNLDGYSAITINVPTSGGSVKYLEYIETNGTQIGWDTGYNIGTDIDAKIYLDFMPISGSGYGDYWFAYYGDCAENVLFRRAGNSSSIGFMFGNNRTRIDGSNYYVVNGNRYLISLDKNGITDENTGTLLVAVSSSSINSTKNLYLNCEGVSGNNQVYRCIRARYYSFRVENGNGETTLDMRPCLDGNNVPCFYDEVSKTYIYHIGSGTPIAGPISDPSYQSGYTDGIAYQKSLLGTTAFTLNGSFSAENGYSAITVNVPQQAGVYGSKTINVNGTYSASTDSLDGFSSVTVNVPTGTTSKDIIMCVSGGCWFNTNYEIEYGDSFDLEHCTFGVAGVYGQHVTLIAGNNYDTLRLNHSSNDVYFRYFYNTINYNIPLPSSGSAFEDNHIIFNSTGITIDGNVVYSYTTNPYSGKGKLIVFADTTNGGNIARGQIAKIGRIKVYGSNGALKATFEPRLDENNFPYFKYIEENIDIYASGDTAPFYEEIVISSLSSITITANTAITASEGGYSAITVNVDTASTYNDGYNDGYDDAFDDVEANAQTLSVSANGTYNTELRADGYLWNEVIVNVPQTGSTSILGEGLFSANGTYSASTDNLDGYSAITVNVPTSANITDTIVYVTANTQAVSASHYNIDGFGNVLIRAGDWWQSGYTSGYSDGTGALSSITLTAATTSVTASSGGFSAITVNVDTTPSWQSGYTSGFTDGYNSGYTDGQSGSLYCLYCENAKFWFPASYQSQGSFTFVDVYAMPTDDFVIWAEGYNGDNPVGAQLYWDNNQRKVYSATAYHTGVSATLSAKAFPQQRKISMHTNGMSVDGTYASQSTFTINELRNNYFSGKSYYLFGFKSLNVNTCAFEPWIDDDGIACLRRTSTPYELLYPYAGTCRPVFKFTSDNGDVYFTGLPTDDYENGVLYQSGYTSGYASGYTDGFSSGSSEGYDSGYTDGYSSGYTNGSASIVSLIDRSITEFVIPSGVTKIGAQAFSSCQNLKSITIPNSVTSINNNAFYYCYSLSSITIPSGVTLLGGSCFYNNYALSSITIPNSVTYLGSQIFYNCQALTSVTFSNSLNEIPSSCCSGCKLLPNVTIPNSIATIGSYSFQNCSALTEVNIGSGVTKIDTQAFRNCIALTVINISATTAPTISNANAFQGVPSTGTVHYPQGSDYSSWQSNQYLSGWTFTADL